MTDNTQQNKIAETLLNLHKALDNSQTLDEMMQAFVAVIETVKETRALTEQEIKNLREMFNEAISEVKFNNSEQFSTLKSQISADFQKQLDKVVSEQDKNTRAITERLAEVKNGEPGKDADETKIVTEVLSKIPPQKEETPEETRDKLEVLQGDERLDKSAIKGIDDIIKELETQINNIPRGRGGGGKGVQILLAGVKGLLTTQTINYIAGTNMTITRTVINGVDTFSFSSSGASANQANNETPSGTVNGVNDTFTLAHTPSPAATLKLYVNGQFMTVTVDYNLSTATITFVSGAIPLTGSIIRAFYDYA